MQDFEKLGLFYLGREYDLEAKRPTDRPLLYESRDLVTHAFCVGMTGSGKTGLSLALLEEAAIDGVPAIAIDPKGDLTNLLLTFPDLSAGQFRPWINEDEARAQGVDAETYAAQQAQRWKQGLAEWGQDADRIRRLRASADFVVFTPGSTAGMPLSIFRSFAAPPRAVMDDAEALAERLQTTITSVLTLIGVPDATPRRRGHVLLSSIVEAAWTAGRDLDLPSLVREVQAPAVTRIGVMDVDTFYPPKDRSELATAINALVAAPGFRSWFEGEPLDVDRLLHDATGRPRMAIVSIAHLGDAERMFFVTLLLNEIVAWMRAQPGTASLRAILYIDEIFGLFPPVANPPSKPPLLTLLKQARAFGLGVALTTQNPVDLDYKGLSNIGTWFLGRLQTERDKARVLDGLEGASTAHGFSRAEVDRALSGLGSRIFLLHNVHEDAPVAFQTRWTMSYLRGPLQREQIRALMAERKAAPASAEGRIAAPAHPPRPAHPSLGGGGAATAPDGGDRPVLAPDVPQYFAPAAPGSSPRYAPHLYASASVAFTDAKHGIDEARTVAFFFPLADSPLVVDWQTGQETDLMPGDLSAEPEPGSTFAPLPAAAAKAKSYGTWSTQFARWVAQTQRRELLRAPGARLASKPEESERDFRVRLQTALREQRDEATRRIRARYAARVASLTERVRNAHAAVAREQSQATQQKVQTAVSFGAGVLGAILGRRSMTASTLGRATTAARGVGRSMKEAQDIERAKANADALQQQLSEIERRAAAEAAQIADTFDAGVQSLETIAVKPRRGGVTVQVVALAWKAL
jgi:hypothetical protein